MDFGQISAGTKTYALVRDDIVVGVRVRVEDREVLLSVADRGVGIPANEIGRIFEQYHRVGNGPSDQAAGSGLGLAIVKHAVEGHGGKVEVESTVGQGSVFTLRLPISDTVASGSVDA